MPPSEYQGGSEACIKGGDFFLVNHSLEELGRTKKAKNANFLKSQNFQKYFWKLGTLHLAFRSWYSTLNIFRESFRACFEYLLIHIEHKVVEKSEIFYISDMGMILSS